MSKSSLLFKNRKISLKLLILPRSLIPQKPKLETPTGDEEAVKDEDLTVHESGCMHLKSRASILIIVLLQKPSLTQIKRSIKRRWRLEILCFGRVSHERINIAISTMLRWQSESHIKRMGNGMLRRLVQQKEGMQWMRMETRLGRLAYDTGSEKLLLTVNSEDLVTIINSQKMQKNLRKLSQR